MKIYVLDLSIRLLYDKDVWIFLPQSYVNQFSTRTPFRNLNENGITHMVYKGKDLNRYSCAQIEFLLVNK